jgi:prepilin-type N-terminal cleavage/methylation domain-containing protein/prepilin-type processing-associated H-X9-DG protein
MKNRLLSSQRSAFTLIELLVVIAIIAILASILFPVFGRARENGRKAACMSNLKQLGLGMMQYSQDYDERFMAYSNSGNPELNYRQTVQPYLKSIQIWRCPSNPSNSTIVNNDNTTGTGWISYAANPRLIMPQWAGPAPSLGFVERAAEKIILGEVRGGTGAASDAQYNYMYPDYGGGGNTKIQDIGFAGHLGRWNCLFVDGHVKSLRPVQTGTPVNMWGTMYDNSGTNCSTGWPVIYTQGINCDQPSNQMLNGLNALERVYN